MLPMCGDILTSSLPRFVQPSLLGSEVAHDLGDNLRGEIGKNLTFFSAQDERKHLFRDIRGRR